MTATAIHILYTGGTIGMIDSPQGLVPSAQDLEQAVRSAVRETWPKVTLHWLSIEPLKDSSQAAMADWARLGQHILELSQFNEPILILHGTDTLAYASSALAFLLPQVHPAVVMTGSQKPWQDPQSDAPSNLHTAVKWALTAPTNTVYLAFNNTIFYGSHVTKYNAMGRDAFMAPQGIQQQTSGRKNNISTLHNWHHKQIEIITCHPGTEYQGLRAILQTQPEVLIIKSLGSGNIPNVHAFLAAFSQAPSPVLVNHSQCLIAAPHQSTYAINNALRDLPWVNPHTLTLEALICKLHLLPNTPLTASAVNAFLLNPIDHELPPIAQSL